MKKLALSCIMVLSTLCATSSDLEAVRSAFYKASLEQNACEVIYNKIKDKDFSNEPVLLGYQGVYEAIMAKYIWNPFSKWRYFQHGTENLEEAIAQDKNNLELLFLRYSIQTNCPAFLGYSDNIDADKQIILSGINNKEVRKRYKSFIPDIVNYMIDSHYISSNEKANLIKIKAQLDKQKAS